MSEEKHPQYVRDLMSVGVATCSPGTPVVQIAKILLEKNLEALVVLDDGEGHALGVVGQAELARVFDCSAENLTAEDVMHDSVPQIPPEIPLSAAAQIMHDQGVRVLFIMHHAAGIEYPAAYISYRHLLRYLAAFQDGEWQPGDISDLGIKAERQSPIEIFLQRRDEARERNRRK